MEAVFRKMLVEKGLEEGEKAEGPRLIDEPAPGTGDPALTLL